MDYYIKLKLKSFKSSEHINEKGDGPYHGFGYLNLVSDPLDLTAWSQRQLLYNSFEVEDEGRWL